LNNAPNWTWWYTHSHICSYVGSHDALKHTSKYALKYVPNCMTWYTPNLLGLMLPSLKSCSHQAPEGRSWVVSSGGHIVAVIITSINFKVWTISLLCPPQWDLAMPHSYGIDIHNFRFGRKCRILDLRTQML
jgi:hypothetical protein